MRCGSDNFCRYVNDGARGTLQVNAAALTQEEGEYELRLLSTCANDNTETPSEVIRGRIDRVPPRLFGSIQVECPIFLYFFKKYIFARVQNNIFYYDLLFLSLSLSKNNNNNLGTC